MKLFRVTAFAVVLLLAPPAFADADSLAGFMESGMSLWHTPGAAAAVVTDDDVVFMQGFGTTTTADGDPVDEHTLFAIASTTKAMVAMGVLKLVDDGRLSLDDPITKHIPDLHFADPWMDREVTVRDLLAHRTGLPSTDSWAFLLDMPTEEAIERMRHVKRVTGMRQTAVYQNTMYEFMGVLIRNVDGREWYELLRDELWQPIGMRETYASRADIPRRKAHALPHFYRDEQLEQTPWDLPAELRNPAGSVWSSIHDMSLWARFLLRGGATADGQQLIAPEVFAEAFEPTQLVSVSQFYPTVELTGPNFRTYALGWYQQDFQGRMIDYHTGSLAGLVAIIGLDRASKRGVVMLANRDHAEFRHALLWHVMDDTIGDKRRDWNADVFDMYERNAAEAADSMEALREARREGTSPSLPLAAYAGTYSADDFGEVTFALDGEELVAELPLHEVRLSHWHDNVFLWDFEQWDFQMLVEFRIGFDGKVSKLEWGDSDFERID